MRLAFLGNDPWSVPPLEALSASNHDVVLVITNPPRPAGRGSRLRPTTVADAARRLGRELVETEGVNVGPGFAALKQTVPDVLVVVAYGELLAPGVMALPPHGAVNLHFSLLPRWRGASPVQRALLAGDPTTGVTVMRMDAGLDTGPILVQQEESVRDDDDAGSLGGRLAELGGPVLTGVIDDLAMDRVRARPQDDAGMTLAPKLTSHDRRINWSVDAPRLVRLVRALAPTPGATTTFRGRPMKILAARVQSGDRTPEPWSPEAGSFGVLLDGPDGPSVETGHGHLSLLEVAPAGRKRMPAAEWARGARIQPGERLG